MDLFFVKGVLLLLVLFSISCDTDPPELGSNSDMSVDSIPDTKIADSGAQDLGADTKEANADLGDANAPDDTGQDMKVEDDLGIMACACSQGEACAEGRCVPDVSIGSQQRANLPETPTQIRFQMPPDQVWPDTTQNPSISLWKGDKFAALSITIDDNPGPDFDWWLSQTQADNFKVTWCIITELVDGGNAFFGTWDEFRNLASKGHSLQSHGTNDREPPSVNSPAATSWFTDAYSNSIPKIESEIAGQKVDVIAHPWGKSIRSLAQQYFIAGRGVRGGANQANKIDYFDLRSSSRGIKKESVDAILPGGREARGWLMFHFHFLANNLRQTTRAELDYVKTKRAQLWVGTMRDITRYGQERDTATLTFHSVEDTTIRFSLSDEMKDDPFDYPLSVKIKLPAGWTDVQSRQSGQQLASTILNHNGSTYALVDAVPDRGPIVVSKK